MANDNKNILILERDEHVAETVCSMAEMLGYRTRVCDSTDGALTELTRKHYDVVITNRVLKNPTVSLPWLIRAVQPDARIVVTTAWLAEQEAAVPADRLLQKPFTLNDLHQAIGMPQ
ncbi:hypothetical protein QPK31_12320 [Massilia sp. YIM B02769]|uniref:response regulator n=1 Tax=unclassified Massilia TaxID=2609279 RepID=UPI0025B6D3FC|nr:MULTISPECIES: response regulator [unclassified Massilia]MDN4059007.1 hypothetical protein [Massilia sp. YIM B02769]